MSNPDKIIGKCFSKIKFIDCVDTIPKYLEKLNTKIEKINNQLDYNNLPIKYRFNNFCKTEESNKPKILKKIPKLTPLKFKSNIVDKETIMLNTAAVSPIRIEEFLFENKLLAKNFKIDIKEFSTSVEKDSTMFKKYREKRNKLKSNVDSNFLSTEASLEVSKLNLAKKLKEPENFSKKILSEQKNSDIMNYTKLSPEKSRIKLENILNFIETFKKSDDFLKESKKELDTNVLSLNKVFQTTNFNPLEIYVTELKENLKPIGEKKPLFFVEKNMAKFYHRSDKHILKTIESINRCDYGSVYKFRNVIKEKFGMKDPTYDDLIVRRADEKTNNNHNKVEMMLKNTSTKKNLVLFNINLREKK